MKILVTLFILFILSTFAAEFAINFETFDKVTRRNTAPQEIPFKKSIKSLSASSDSHSFILTTENTLYGYGDNKVQEIQFF
jgi:alpha-tubulin suppressor-like RCC1 family protein